MDTEQAFNEGILIGLEAAAIMAERNGVYILAGRIREYARERRAILMTYQQRALADTIEARQR